MGRAFRIVTTAGLIGLAVLHPAPFARLLDVAVGTFRSAVRVAP